MINLDQLLYLKTKPTLEANTECVFQTYSIDLPAASNKIIKYLLKQYNLDLHHQVSLTKRFLNINKLVPLYFSQSLILFPIKHKRAPLQIYINAYQITGLSSKGSQTIIYFTNQKYIFVDENYIFIYKKWLEALSLKSFYKV
ncbi:competence protein ComK [Staphylococcus sp. SQ8-PEA]|uniref:Competence protein ComK n=1 Tax=Staphylococcus marylandisciuri TaxID=2981529 RepID=A0ABT2QS76_9STAP|nr:competence protein ComK [Staphylococcus marylandisciuri]MCU5746835.1 competence protein ComK [Staphylococcus marylandisciuri]